MKSQSENPESTVSSDIDTYYGYHSATLHSTNLTALFRHLEGKTLTIIDASFADPQQRSAMKSLIRDALWSDYRVIQEWMAEQKEGEGSSFPL